MRSRSTSSDQHGAPALLDAVFEAIPLPAFVLDPRGGLVGANVAGREWLARDRTGHKAALRNAALGRAEPGRFRTTEVRAVGASRRFLVLAVDAAQTTHASRTAATHWGFSPREAQVLALLGAGLTNRAIAAELAVAERTVESHLTSMYCKAQVETRAELVVRAWRIR